MLLLGCCPCCWGLIWVEVDKVLTAKELRGDSKGQRRVLQGKSPSVGLRLLPSRLAAAAIIQAILTAYHRILNRGLRQRLKSTHNSQSNFTYAGVQIAQ